MYLTPSRFKTMGMGNDTSTVSDITLRSLIDQAAQLVNSYCAVPATPQRHDFRGGAVVGEQHRWPLPEMTFSNQSSRRVYPFHQPLRAITNFTVKFTNTYSVNVDPANLYVNATESWAEVVSIAAIVSGVYPVGINFGLYTPVAEVSYTYGWRYAVTSELLQATSGAFTVYQAPNQFWATDVVPVVRVNGSIVGTGFTLDYTEGTVTFSPAKITTDVVTLDYTYTMPSAIAWATAMLTSKLLAESDLIAKGMGNLASIRVEEVELRRTYRPEGGTRALVESMDPVAATYLSDFLYMTVRG